MRYNKLQFDRTIIVSVDKKLNSPNFPGKNDMLIDDFSEAALVSKLDTPWRFVSDQVMGGISQGQIIREIIGGHNSLHLRGMVSLENNGGFIQAALDLNVAGKEFDGSAFTGLCLSVRGNNEKYGLHLRTSDCIRPWQSYRTEFHAGAKWRSIEIPFHDFHPYRIEKPFNTGRLKRIGLVAIGRKFNADLALSRISFYC